MSKCACGVLGQPADFVDEAAMRGNRAQAESRPAADAFGTAAHLGAHKSAAEAVQRCFARGQRSVELLCLHARTHTHARTRAHQSMATGMRHERGPQTRV